MQASAAAVVRPTYRRVRTKSFCLHGYLLYKGSQGGRIQFSPRRAHSASHVKVHSASDAHPTRNLGPTPCTPTTHPTTRFSYGKAYTKRSKEGISPAQLLLMREFLESHSRAIHEAVNGELLRRAEQSAHCIAQWIVLNIIAHSCNPQQIGSKLLEDADAMQKLHSDCKHAFDYLMFEYRDEGDEPAIELITNSPSSPQR